MTTRTADLLSLSFILAAAVVAAVLYPDLPEMIPSHWNARGEVDDYMAKPWGVIILPLTAMLCWGVFKVIPRISPKGFRTGEFQAVINIFQLTMVVFLSIISVLVLLAAAGIGDYVGNAVPVGVGILFVVLGNYMGKLRKNFFIGIRTPWTLASSEVWARTHRFGGWVFMLCGLLLIGAGVLGKTPLFLIGTTVIAALMPVAYSFLLYRRLEGFGDDEPGDEASSG